MPGFCFSAATFPRRSLQTAYCALSLLHTICAQWLSAKMRVH